MFSYATHLSCSKCGGTSEINRIMQQCSCGAPLLVQYDLAKLRNRLKPEDLRNRVHSMWRYHELLPVQDHAHIVSAGEGMTPLLPLPRLADDMGIFRLLMKDEGISPGGTFKVRGATVGVSRAKELGVKELSMPTNGNAGAAWALYAAKAGIQCHIVMPLDAPLTAKVECVIAGAHLALVNGLISDAGNTIAQSIKEHGWYDASTLKEPYRIEGKKTMGFEIVEQLEWQLPDVILYPTGGGVGLIGIYKALQELRELGWIGDRLPRLVAVQSEGCAPIVKAWSEQKQTSTFWSGASTVAFGINVPKALGDFLVLEAIHQTAGCALAVEDDTILQEQKRIARLEGAYVCPEGAAAFAAARRLRDSGWISVDETVVVLNTGAGIKYPDSVQLNLPILQPGQPLPSSHLTDHKD